ISAGQTASFPLSVSPAGGLNDMVSATCTGTIPAGSCNVSPSSPFPLNSVVTVTATVTTTAPSSATFVPPGSFGRPGTLEPVRALLQLLFAVGLFCVLALASRFRRRAWALAASAILLVALSAGFSGCAGGSGNPGVVGHSAGTPAGAYSVTVTIKTSS